MDGAVEFPEEGNFQLSGSVIIGLKALKDFIEALVEESPELG